jgi:hypothetical protein
LYQPVINDDVLKKFRTKIVILEIKCTTVKRRKGESEKRRKGRVGEKE